jgi:non-lysosomal glucosylceramidase
MAREKTARRAFLQRLALGAGAAAQRSGASPQLSGPRGPQSRSSAGQAAGIPFPRVFTGRRLKMIAFPLGGVAAGSISLGGRGQLRDWEIFNKPDKGASPVYAFPSIWVQTARDTPIARVLEARIQPPYEGQSGLGFRNVPGLERLDSATFTGEFPLARIDFHDTTMPVRVRLEAFSPFVPLDAEDSGLPVAVLRYRVVNPGKLMAKVSIAFSIDNPVGSTQVRPSQGSPGDTRANEYRRSRGLDGLLMTNPGLKINDALKGSFALCLVGAGEGKVSALRGWEKGRWWNSPMLFWDDFSADVRKPHLAMPSALSVFSEPSRPAPKRTILFC